MPLMIMGVQNVHVSANNQLDTQIRGRLIGLHQAKKIVVIRNGYRRHTQFRHPA